MVEQHTTPFHRTQLALREIGHLLLTPHLPDARGDPIPGRLELTAHPADQQALYDQFGHLLLERAEQQQELATTTDPRRAAALRAAAVLEGRP